MVSVRDDFIRRKGEVEKYINYLKLLDRDDVRLVVTNNIGDRETSEIEADFLTTLTANSFLLLYNLIESTVRNSIIEIYNSIKSDEITYDQLSDKLKKLYTKYSTEKFKEGAFRMETIRNFVLEFADQIVSREIIEFSGDWLDFSGNLDAKEIRKIATRVGFEPSPDGRNLLEIKNKRNRLAHGEQTFYEVGKNYTVREIDELRLEVFAFLEDVIGKVDQFITEKAYNSDRS